MGKTLTSSSLQSASTKASVQDPEYHRALISNQEQILSVAGVHPRFLWSPMKTHCLAEEVDWVKHNQKYMMQGVPGLLLCGVPQPETHVQAIAAAFLRNYKDARVMSLHQVLSLLDKGNMPMPTVLLIPNLYLSMPTTSTNKSLPAWKVLSLHDYLLQRDVKGKATVAYVDSLEGVKAEYGDHFHSFLEKYKIVKG